MALTDVLDIHSMFTYARKSEGVPGLIEILSCLHSPTPTNSRGGGMGTAAVGGLASHWKLVSVVNAPASRNSCPVKTQYILCGDGLDHGAGRLVIRDRMYSLPNGDGKSPDTGPPAAELDDVRLSFTSSVTSSS